MVLPRLPSFRRSSHAFSEPVGLRDHFRGGAFLLARAFFSTMRSTTTNSSNPVGIRKTHLFNSLTAQQLNSLTLLLMTMAFALSDEIHQLFVPGRAFQVIDLIIDFLGILFGVYLYKRLKIEPQRHEGTKKIKVNSIPLWVRKIPLISSKITNNYDFNLNLHNYRIFVL